MELDELLKITTPLLLIGAGIFLKTTNHKSFQSAKGYWKTLIILGSVSILLDAIIIFQKH